MNGVGTIQIEWPDRPAPFCGPERGKSGLTLQDGDDHHELRCGNVENAWLFRLLCVIERPGRSDDDSRGDVRAKR